MYIIHILMYVVSFVPIYFTRTTLTVGQYCSFLSGNEAAWKKMVNISHKTIKLSAA